ncbi:MAG: hypothetical protein ACK5V4_02505, partial [Alphaproteobacteria bacterium]
MSQPEMSLSFTTSKRMRKFFGNIQTVAKIPNLILVQKKSYESFLQYSIQSDKRDNFGLENVFRSIFPIKDYDDRATIEYVKYDLDKPKYDVEEC